MVETANLRIPVFRFDAFSHGPLSGNPAAVCPLDRWLADATMQAIAAEMGLSETAFFVPHGEDYDIRWFTPAVEVEICGHATLASAAVVFERLQPGKTRMVFYSQSGPLVVARQGELLEVDLPALLPKIVAIADELVAALGVRPMVALEAGRVFAVFENSETIRSLKPNFSRLASLYPLGIGVSSPGTGEDADVDFVSRYFAPAKGVPEDPVTGSAHCTLTPYWAQRIGKNRLLARQVSQRPGDLIVTLRDARVGIAGKVRLVMEGTLYV
jgi:PhzF family phenazine biosynthesis protein